MDYLNFTFFVGRVASGRTKVVRSDQSHSNEGQIELTYSKKPARLAPSMGEKIHHIH